jgi:hypothetical protein
MTRLFRNILGLIILAATIGMATIQSMFNASPDDTKATTLQQPKGDL